MYLLSKYEKILASAAFCLFICCMFYTFNGSTLPSYIKTVEIPLFFNETLQPAVAEELTQRLSAKIVQVNLLRVVPSNADATILGKVIQYENTPHTYGSSARREIDVSQYAVRITVEVEFLDNKKEQALYKGRISALGIYDYAKENEDFGRQKAVADIIDQIIQNSVQGW